MGALRRTLVVVLAVVGLAAVAALFVQPSLVLGQVPAAAAWVRGLDPSEALLLAVGLLGLLAVVTLVVSSLTRGAGATRGAIEGSSASSRALYGSEDADLDQLGAAVDAALAVATDYETANESDRRGARETVESALRAAAVTAYAQSTGRTPEHAETAVASGEWTEDRRAAGLLATDEDVSVPVHVWLLDLLLGRDPFVEGVERSVSAIAALNDDDLDGERDRTTVEEQGVTGR